MDRVLGILFSLGVLAGGAAHAKADFIYTTLAGTLASGINDSGDIVGQYQEGSYLYSGGSYTALNLPPSNGPAVAWGINNALQIAGSYEAADGTRGFFGRIGGGYASIDVPGSVGTIAYGVNNAGQVVGSFYTGSLPGGISHGFLLSAGTFTTIDVPGSTDTGAYGLNNRNQIVGAYSDARGIDHGYLWTQGNYISIDVPGAVNTVAQGINNAGDIVGEYVDASNHLNGFLLSDGSFTTIDVPGAISTQVFGINDLDQIVGLYDDAFGEPHAFLATPVPEPPTLLLLATGAIALICFWCPWKRP
jgi:uncharacterized membrane protein